MDDKNEFGSLDDELQMIIPSNPPPPDSLGRKRGHGDQVYVAIGRVDAEGFHETHLLYAKCDTHAMQAMRTWIEQHRNDAMPLECAWLEIFLKGFSRIIRPDGVSRLTYIDCPRNKSENWLDSRWTTRPLDQWFEAEGTASYMRPDQALEIVPNVSNWDTRGKTFRAREKGRRSMATKAEEYKQKMKEGFNLGNDEHGYWLPTTEDHLYEILAALRKEAVETIYPHDTNDVVYVFADGSILVLWEEGGIYPKPSKTFLSDAAYVEWYRRMRAELRRQRIEEGWMTEADQRRFAVQELGTAAKRLDRLREKIEELSPEAKEIIAIHEQIAIKEERIPSPPPHAFCFTKQVMPEELRRALDTDCRTYYDFIQWQPQLPKGLEEPQKKGE